LATRRVTMREAAEILGVSKEAIRKRVIRGTMRSETGGDGRRCVYIDAGGDEAPTHERDVLISEMRGRIEDLREQLQAERQAHAEARRLLAAAMERIPPQLEAPSEPSEAPVAASGVEDRASRLGKRLLRPQKANFAGRGGVGYLVNEQESRGRDQRRSK
jgi:hypothetical protein